MSDPKRPANCPATRERDNWCPECRMFAVDECVRVADPDAVKIVNQGLDGAAR